MSINNREDVNKYYKIVNELVDDFMVNGKIKPSSLKRYLKPEKKFKNFLKKNNLSSVNGIEKVLSDVIDSRVNMESDGVIKFESFKIFESDEYKLLTLGECISKGVGKTDINEEKFLADYFDTNLGYIDIIDSERHLYKINSWEKETEVIIYSKEDFEIIYHNIIDFLINDFLKKETDLTTGVRISLDKTVDISKLKTELEKNVNIDKVCNIIKSYLNDEYDYLDLDNYIIFIKID
jgi:hypothetical protein